MLPKQQITPEYRAALEKQQYRFVGNHSAVKVCGWTKNLILNKGGCYKFKFYGIRSHQCLQMTTSMFCASRCVFCWRGEKAPLSQEWYGPIDNPSYIVDEAIAQHIGLLIGYKGNEKANKRFTKEMQEVRHVALSLTGEPITYPQINGVLEEFHKRKISTFLVSNAQYPDEIASIKNVTQLYLSIDAPNKDLFKRVDRPMFSDYYERMLKCLDALAHKKCRTCIRLTIVKGINDTDIERYAELIMRGKPDYIEVKGYVHVGASQGLLKINNMPYMEDIEAFSEKLDVLLHDYEIADVHKPSKVLLFVRKGIPRYINFPKFFEIVNEGKQAEAKEYSADVMCPNI
ncbi:MAG: 4-demethylwyosine synthase TYW1 [Candidatus Woesearchaeota archaeon]